MFYYAIINYVPAISVRLIMVLYKFLEVKPIFKNVIGFQPPCGEGVVH